MMEEWKKFGEFPVEKLSSYTMIGEGLGRNVYSYDDDHCIKFPRWEEGIKECQVEAEIYRNADPKYKKMLCPIIFDGEGLVVMKKAVPLQYARVNDRIYDYTTSRKVRKLIDYLVETFDLWRPDIEKVSQWGYIDDRLVLLDYGRNMELMEGCIV